MSGQTAAFNGGSDRNSARALQMQQSCVEATAALETAKGRASAAADEVVQLSAKLQEAADQRTQLNDRLTALQVCLFHCTFDSCLGHQHAVYEIICLSSSFFTRCCWCVSLPALGFTSCS